MSGGICADCWAIKDPAKAVDLRPPPRTESLFDWDDDYEWYGIPSGFVYLALLLVLVVACVYVTFR